MCRPLHLADIKGILVDFPPKKAQLLVIFLHFRSLYSLLCLILGWLPLLFSNSSKQDPAIQNPSVEDLYWKKNMNLSRVPSVTQVVPYHHPKVAKF